MAFAKLPDPCKSVASKSIESFVPEAKEKNGTAAKSNDLANRASCSWNGLQTDGTKGSQYRWLSVSMVRYDSHATLGSGDKRAEEQYNKQIELAKTTEGAHDVKVEQAGGIGDQGSSVVYGVKKDVDFFNTTVVVRTHNVVVTLDYNGAAYEGRRRAGPGEAAAGRRRGGPRDRGVGGLREQGRGRSRAGSFGFRFAFRFGLAVGFGFRAAVGDGRLRALGDG